VNTETGNVQCNGIGGRRFVRVIERGIPTLRRAGRMFAAALAVGLLAGNALAETYLADGGDENSNYPDPVSGKTYAVHKFTSTAGGTFTPSQDLTVDYLVVAGGGSGARKNNGAAGGGGAGGMLTGTANVTASINYTIAVGAGGAAVTSGSEMNGNKGVDSAFGSGVNLIATAIGGGRGGVGAGGNGGSGGGGTTGGSGTLGQGSNGGGSTGGGGGKGGAGGAGASPNGGAGESSDITGASIVYAAGGSGKRNPSLNGTDGRGEGGSGGSPTTSGRGGSGIVIIRYEIPLRGGTVLLFR